MMNDQIRAAEDYDDFLVSIYTEEKQWDNFSERTLCGKSISSEKAK